MLMSQMDKFTAQQVIEAINSSGSITKAALILGVKGPTIQWWLARNGYKVEKVAKVVPIVPGEQRSEDEEGKGS